MTRAGPSSGGLPRRRPAGGGAWTAGLLGVIAGIFAATGPGHATTTTANIAVSMTITPTCQTNLTTLAFGTYAGVQSDVTASVNLTCTNSTPFTIAINAGQQSTGNYQWNMAGPGATRLAYQIFRDSGRTNLWGGSQGVDTVGGTGTGAAVVIPMYGRMKAAQYVQPGAYTDTVTMTVSY